MTTTPVRVAVNGYGVIGKRVADAVRLQDDMVLAGVADVATDYRLQTARALGVPIFGASTEATASMREAVYLTYHVANEAIVIPETIDAIRAMTELETDGARSMAKTDASLGIPETVRGATAERGLAGAASRRMTWTIALLLGRDPWAVTALARIARPEIHGVLQ